MKPNKQTVKYPLSFVVAGILIGALIGAIFMGVFVASATSLTLGPGISVFNGLNGNSITQEEYNGDNFLLIRSATPGIYTKLMLAPNGAGQDGWTTLLQLANTDFFSDPDNYEIMEVTWEGNYAFINVWANGTGTQRTLALMLDATPILKLDIGNSSVYGDDGEFFVWLSRPLYFTKDGTWASPINITNLGTEKGSVGNPITTPAFVARVPQAYSLAYGNNTFKVYCTLLGGNSHALVFDDRLNDGDFTNVYIENLARDWSSTVENELRINVINLGTNPYALQGDIYLYVELRY